MPAENKKYLPPPAPLPDIGAGEFLGTKGGSKRPFYNYQKGTFEVENLEERADEGISYQITDKRDGFFFTRDLDVNTQIQFVPLEVKKQYKTNVSLKLEVKKAFAVFENSVKRFITKNLGRYKTARKGLKKEIDTIAENKNEYIFSQDRNGERWSQIYIDSTQFGPYNYDVRLHTTKDIEMINDLIVIRTGDYGLPFPSRKIAWVSKHDAVTYSGRGVYTSTGIDVASTIWNTGVIGYSGFASFKERHYGLTNEYPVHALSSKFHNIPSGEVLNDYTQYYQIDNRGPAVAVQHSTDHLGEAFSNIYDEYDGIYDTGIFDGVIKSGSWFTIETWSTNPRYIGFDGEIKILPVYLDGDDNYKDYDALVEDIDVSEEVSCVSVNSNYQVGLRAAVNGAKKKFYKKLNKILYQKGIRNKPARYRKYEQMLERVAQNIYQGLSLVRDEQVAKAQGTVTNPLDAPTYYDGTSTMYGGSKEESLYDHSKTAGVRQAGAGLAGTGTSSTSGAGTAGGGEGTTY